MGAPRDDLVRAVYPGIELRAAEEPGPGRLTGHFSTFDDWYEVDSAYEGHFLERIAPGAFTDTMAADKASMRVLFNHGADPQVGDKPLGPIDVLREDETGGYYEVPLLDTSYVRDIAPGLRAGVYGSSFRFNVRDEQWDDKPPRATHNPQGLPERTITDARVFEFGPVTFPANPSASAGVRSLTDRFRGIPAEPSHVPDRKETPKMTTPTAAVPERDMPIEEKRARVAELSEELARIDAAYPGSLPDEEQARWDADKAEMDRLTVHIRDWDRRKTELALAVQDVRNVEQAVTPSYVERHVGTNQIMRPTSEEIFSIEERGFRSIEERNQKWRDDAMRAIEITRWPHPDTDIPRTENKLAWMLDNIDSRDKELARRIKLTGSPTYARAFDKIVRTRGTLSLSPEEQRGTALAIGVDATGGFLIPFAFDPSVIAIGAWNGAINPYRRSCRVVQIVGTDTWQALTSTAVVATRALEAAPAVEQGPTFARPEYVVKRVQGQITASFEAFQDRADLAAEMGTLIQEAKDNEEETSFATGVGTTVFPLGVGPVSGTVGAYTAVAGAGAGVLAQADAVATEAALPVRHRFGAQWFMSRTNIRKFQDVETTGGKLFGGSQYPAVGNPALVGDGNTGLRLLGYPVNESPSLPVATTTTITAAALIQPQSYVIVDRIGMSINFIPWIMNSSGLATGQQAIYFLYRNQAAPINVDAGRVLRFL